MGTITIKYSIDGINWKNEAIYAGRYKVGISVEGNANYEGTTEIMTNDDWNFTIQEAPPTQDFLIITTMEDSTPIYKLVSDKKTILYNQKLENNTNILPTSRMGKWEFKDPEKVLNSVGNSYVEVLFTPTDPDNYDWSKIQGYDKESKKIIVKLLISVEVDKSGWGEKKEVKKIDMYVDKNGTTSTEITGTNGIYWVKEESYDVDLKKVTSAWYGVYNFKVDNSESVFEPGSRLCVRWINKKENAEE